MRIAHGTRSAASRVFLVLVALAIGAGVLAGALLVWSSQTAARSEAAESTRALASTLVLSPTITTALSAQGSARGTAADTAQDYVHLVVESTSLDFVTVMSPDGIRLTHPDPAQLGKSYVGTIPAEPTSLTEEFTGTLGPSIRTISPVLVGGDLAGWVSVGVTVESVGESVVRRLPAAFIVALGIMAAGSIGAVLARHYTRKIAGDLPPGSVRDAVSAYESMRTLGEALQAQTHEHGNRLHTAVALLELGRTDDAIELLAESSRQSQQLVDQVATRRHGDPTVGALLLGKAAQAKERGVEWLTEIDPAAPASVLSPVDSVSVLGNLIDNALDAVTEASPRWVRVHLRSEQPGWVTLTVSDSGPGISDTVARRMFEHGYSTKSAHSSGRGVGLALVRSIAEGAGGSVNVSGSPTTFEVRLPARAAKGARS